MSNFVIAYLAAALAGAALAAVVVNLETLLLLLQLIALVSGPVLIFTMIRSARKASRAGQTTNAASKEERLNALRERFRESVQQQQSLRRQIAALEAEPSLPLSPVVQEAERVARDAVKRHRPSSPRG